ncbi:MULTISPECIES: hypothetical protein [unclassified Caballeronia]|uniref:hypothetical protein n=1 Tax=unclassified Caballeronia TaxID=2646786 RepID=UPI002027CE57|nr:MULTISPECIES: hypothetical protein [unclassified Caballeronia]
MPTNRKRSCSEIRNDMISEWQIAQPRRVRRIVTRSGRGVRGVFPSRKSSKPAEFESLAEEMALLVLEIATSITHIETQPTVFEFCDSDASRRYTPDIATQSAVGTTYFEVKYDKALAPDGDTVTRLRRAVNHLRGEGHVLRFLLESELAASHLPNKIRELLRARPPRGRYRANIDPTLWDPECGTSPGPAMLERWQSAQRQCDELLARVMRRDPDDLLPAEQR